jgi:hypothetical protein
VSKRINVTLPDAVHDELEWWAESQGRPTANLANFLIESAIRQAKERGEIPPKPVPPPNNHKKKSPSLSKSKGEKVDKDK